ncbi:MAG: HNH endonuclease signature motif containing protein [Acetobacter malorum]|uniref:HNH endonuclease n=1 Tax=Acetobacter malorum TaxID=178901 RepID=UPI0039ECA951
MTKLPRNTGLGKRFRKALETRFKAAVAEGKDQVTITANDLIKDLGDEGVNRAPSCCRVMKNALTDSDEIVHSSASGETPALKITYVLPRPKPEKIPMPDVWPFVPGKTYQRRNYIHRVYGGQQQGGISTPSKASGIFIFTGHGEGQVGYRDTFQPDGSFHYTGQGQIGDMQMVSGNAAIVNHAANGKDLLLFSQEGKGAPVRFRGFYTCAGWHTERQKDIEGNERNAIVFTLSPLTSDETEDAVEEPTTDLQNPASFSLQDLRRRALEAAAAPPRRTNTGSRSVYARSRDVRNYVLRRADGVCESCDQPAPFETAAGLPYLEAHHIRRLSDGGPDDPRFVAGICPTCHRRAHHGADAAEVNRKMQAVVNRKEKLIKQGAGS